MDDFNKVAATILSNLYETFPCRQSLRISNMVESKDEGARQLYGDTVLFLATEGFIRYEYRSTTQSFDGVTLTSKGLAILNSTPGAIKEKTPLGSKLSSAVKEGSKEVLKAVVDQVVKSAMGA